MTSNEGDNKMIQHDLFGNAVLDTPPLEREALEAAIFDTLFGLSDVELAGLLVSRFDAVVEFGRLCRGDRGAGNRISLLFNPHRLDTATLNCPSIIAAVNDPESTFLSGLARAAAWKEDKVNHLLYQILQVGVNGVQYVNEFPPYLARKIYTDFGARRILDPCAGWGGRMIGAASVGSHYVGFEPSTKTYAGLLELAGWLSMFDTGFTYELVNEPFEDVTITDRFDLALTSPPYYDTEAYADEPTQAGVRYRSFDEFVRGFLHPMVMTATTAASQGFVCNIGSRRYPMRDAIDLFDVNVSDAGYQLGGTAGLGKEGGDGEVFLHLQRTTDRGYTGPVVRWSAPPVIKP